MPVTKPSLLRVALVGGGALLLWGAGLSLEQRVRQVEKQARLTREAAERYVAAAEETQAAGRPQAMSVLESEAVEMGKQLDRLEQRLGELEAQLDADERAESSMGAGSEETPTP